VARGVLWRPVVMVATPREHTPAGPGLDATLPLSGTTMRAVAGGAIERIPEGTAVGDYEVLELRSRGGFGAVYRARHRRTRQQVALKVLHADLAVSGDKVKRFEREAATLNRIRHPNIVRVFDVGVLADGRPFFAMEWLTGSTLADAIRDRGALELPEALPIIEDLCCALAAAHDVGIVHRDLKASNVMLVPAGDRFAVRLFDFGIAKLLAPDGELGHVSTGNRLGTPHHMAPEQILGDPVDPRTDVYSLGVLIYQILTGRFPFDGANSVEIEELHLHAAPPRASDHAAVPGEVDDVLFGCLAKLPALRHATAREVAAELRAAVGTSARQRAARAQALRPSVRDAATRRAAVGIRVALVAGERTETGAVENAMYEIRADLRAHGFDIAEDGDGALLAVAALPDGATEAAAARRRAIERALSAAYRYVAATDALRFVVHAAPVLVLAADGRREYLGGDLLLPAWAAGSGRPGVWATDAALAGVADAFVLGARTASAYSVIAGR
jgi:serine/threonine-protein kinase